MNGIVNSSASETRWVFLLDKIWIWLFVVVENVIFSAFAFSSPIFEADKIRFSSIELLWFLWANMHVHESKRVSVIIESVVLPTGERKNVEIPPNLSVTALAIHQNQGSTANVRVERDK